MPWQHEVWLSLSIADIKFGQRDISPHLHHLHRTDRDSMVKVVIGLAIDHYLQKGKIHQKDSIPPNKLSACSLWCRSTWNIQPENASLYNWTWRTHFFFCRLPLVTIWDSCSLYFQCFLSFLQWGSITPCHMGHSCSASLLCWKISKARDLFPKLESLHLAQGQPRGQCSAMFAECIHFSYTNYDCCLLLMTQFLSGIAQI